MGCHFSLMTIILTVLASLFMISLIFIIPAEAASNPNLFVSAENTKFKNHFSGSMVIEVIIRDNNIRDTDQGKGEPDVTINGKTLRMVQATDGNWYAYFANVDKAKAADATVAMPGKGLDFGVICDRNTPSSIFGVSFSETDGFAVSGNDCSGDPSPSINNVVRKPRSINTNPLIPTGQIGLNSSAWPLVQLFSFSNDVVIQYNPAGGPQKVTLQYNDIPNISISTDRQLHPSNSEVFVIIDDFQLNQDPTDEDSWTFNIESPQTTFYQAFDNSGRESAANTDGLVNLIPSLSSIGFEDNGIFHVDLNSVLELKPNSDQNGMFSIDDDANVATPAKFSKIVTFVEQGPNSGIFENFDSNDQSTIKVTSNAPRGHTGKLEYNEQSISILTGSSTASVSLQKPELKIEGSTKSLSPGTKYSLVLTDPDQNINSNSRDDLDIFRDSSLIPTLRIGNPITLEKSSNLQFYMSSSDNLITDGHIALSSNPDKNSARLFIDTSVLGITIFEKISLNLGITSTQLRSLFVNNMGSDNIGTNWLNYDFRSIQNDLGVTDFRDTSIELFIGSLSSSPIIIVNPGDISQPQGLVNIPDTVVNQINVDGQVFIVINFDASNNTLDSGKIPSSVGKQPVVLDFFSFGLTNDLSGINNSIYRIELEETQDNSSTFEGTIEYAITNQLNILDSNFINKIKTNSDKIKFLVTDKLVDEHGIFISYSDLDKVGVTITTSTQSNIPTHSGSVSTDSKSYRFGQPVTVILNDPDLNLKSDTIETYHVIDDPNSPNVDTVGKNGVTLLEILIKDIRYKRCTIDGVEYGGLASTGFVLVETGTSTGIFEGVFKMPSKICDKKGDKLISPAGGSIELKYNDARDNLGETNIFSSTNNRQPISTSTFHSPHLSKYEISHPSSNLVEEIILSGSIDSQRRGIPLEITLIHPNGNTQEFSASVASNGNYKTIFSISSKSLSGEYKIVLAYAGKNIGSVSFNVLEKTIPSWIKDNAKWWSSSSIDDSEFIAGLEYLIKEDIIPIAPSDRNSSSKNVPSWIKDNAKWWSNDQISDEDFIKSIQYLVTKGIIRI